MKNKVRCYKKTVSGVQFILKDAIEVAKEYEGFLKIDDDNKVKIRCTIKYFCIDIDIDVSFGGKAIVASIYNRKFGRQYLEDKNWLIMDASGVVRRLNNEEFKEQYELVK